MGYSLPEKKYYSKTCAKRPLSKRPKIVFQDQLSLNAGQKYCGMLQGEHSAILSTFIKLPFVIKIYVLSTFEWPFTQVILYAYTVKKLNNLDSDSLIDQLIPIKFFDAFDSENRAYL